MTVYGTNSISIYVSPDNTVHRPSGFGVAGTHVSDTHTAFLIPPKHSVRVIMSFRKPEVSVPGSLRNKKNRLTEKQEQRADAKRKTPTNPLFVRLGIEK